MKESEYKVDRLDAMIRALQNENNELHEEISRLRNERDKDAKLMVMAEILLLFLGVLIGLGIAVGIK